MQIVTRRDFLRGASSFGVAMLGATAFDMAAAQDVLKVGVVHQFPIGDVGWETQQMLGWKAMEAAFPGKIKTTIVTDVQQSQDAERVFRELASQGNKLVFGTTFSQMAPMLKVARAMPATMFECCAAVTTTKNMGAFEARNYEPTYLAGVIAGRMTKSNVLGWVGAFPVPQVVWRLNGFLIGARSVNPKVTCNVIWINTWNDPAKEKDAVAALITQGADVLSGSPNTPVQGIAAQERGAWSVANCSDFSKYVTKKQLTGDILDWRSAYIEAARNMLAGTWKSENLFRGLGEGGFCTMAPYNSAIPEAVITDVNAREKDIIAGKLKVFAGPLKDRDGKQRVAAGASLPDKEIRSIDWVVEG
ncbi:MAG: BMP family ABC transporter substrate-binding protein, partial [Acidobacteriota bacterium]|nr:BMP family ABC transporter substrate-binding protein [Acidobacteriota bacterium]